MISFVGLVKACLPFSHKHAQSNAVAWRRFCELHHYFVGCVPQARTRLLKSNSRVRVGYAATHPTHETRPLRGSPCERGAYSAELQTAPRVGAADNSSAGLGFCRVAVQVMVWKEVYWRQQCLTPPPGTHEKGIRLFHGYPDPSPTGGGKCPFTYT